MHPEDGLAEGGVVWCCVVESQAVLSMQVV